MNISLAAENLTVISGVTPYISFEIFLSLALISLALLIISHYRDDILLGSLALIFSGGTVYTSLAVAFINYAVSSSESYVNIVPVVTAASSPALTIICVMLLIACLLNLIYIITEITMTVGKTVKNPDIEIPKISVGVKR